MPTPARPAALLAVALLFPASCAPLSVTFTLGQRDSRLEQTEVFSDKNAGDAKVAMIDVRGLIIDAPRRELFGAGSNPVDELVARLRKAGEDPSVKAVVIRINSPGGTVTASDTMYREVRRFADQTRKPVVASLGEVAASGGYYLALAADEIVTQPTTITASIGVIIPTVNFSGGLAKLGIESRSIKSGVNKDIANPLEPIREGQYAVLQGMVDEFYARFKGLVVERRFNHSGAGVPPAFDDLTDGRIITGAAAVRAGLADRGGGLHDAFDRAKTLAHIPAASLIKYHNADGLKPRTAYAEAAPLTPLTASPETELNLLKIDATGLSSQPSGANAYYLWTGAGP